MGSIDWNKINSILGSKAFENAAGVAGAGISAYAGSKGAATDARQSAAQFAAQMALQQQSAQENQRQGAATSAAAAAPLGANENFALKQGLLRSILPGLRNASVTPGDPRVAAAMGKGVQGGFRLPEGGIPAEALASLSPQATAGAISQRQGHIANIDPNSPGVNFQRMGFQPDVAGPIQAETDQYQSGVARRVGDQQSQTAEQLRMALEQNYASAQPEQKKSGGLLSKIGSALKFAAPIAGTLIGGPGLGAAIGAIGSGVGSAMQGSGVGGALKSAAVGGAVAGAGNAAIPGRAPGLSGANGAAQWAQTAAPVINRLPQRQQPQVGGAGVNPEMLAAALRRQRFGG